jgi:hypothetical protein
MKLVVTAALAAVSLVAVAGCSRQAPPPASPLVELNAAQVERPAVAPPPDEFEFTVGEAKPPKPKSPDAPATVMQANQARPAAKTGLVHAAGE